MTDESLASRREFLRETLALAACLAAVPSLSALRLVGEQAVYPIPKEDGVTIDRDHEVMLARSQNSIYAFGLSCPHQRTPLRWQEEQRRFQCPKHKSTFQLDGAFVSGRATRSLDRYALARDGDTVVVDLSALLQEERDRERWVNAVLQL